MPEQPFGCEDLGEENNAVDRFLVGLFFYFTLKTVTIGRWSDGCQKFEKP